MNPLNTIVVGVNEAIHKHSLQALKILKISPLENNEVKKGLSQPRPNIYNKKNEKMGVEPLPQKLGWVIVFLGSYPATQSHVWARMGL